MSTASTFDGPLLQGRWQLGPTLGRGGQGTTFLARDEHYDGRVVVVKQLELRAAAGWKRFDLFEREARVLESIDHPGIPAFLAHFEGDAGTFYLVMERARGTDLREAMRSGGGFDETALRDILAQTLALLQYLHERTPPIIHRDVKPANLVRDDRGRVSLVDFGGVRDVLREDGGSTVVGTFGYMAPEQLHGQALPATDLYGLGATIAALAGGVEPETIPRRGLRMDLRGHLRGLSSGLLELLERMTAPEPEARPQSAAEVIALLEQRPMTRRERRRAEAATAASARRSAAQARNPKAPDHAPDDETDVLPLDLDLPPPLRQALALSLWAFASAGRVGLVALRAVLVPLLFTIASAFISAKSRPTLRRAREATYGALEAGQQGFARLQRAARAEPRRLPGRRP